METHDHDLMPFYYIYLGLPEPKPDQTEEMLVESMLKLVNLPQTSVRTAVRLPLLSKGRSVL
jgi:hypothetical protein